MKKILLVLLILFIFSSVFIWFIKNYIGDLRPVILPAVKKQISNTNKPKLGKPLDFVLNIPEGFQIGVFASDLGKVRDITFSPGGVLVASVPELGKVVMLPDRNNDGIADEVTTIVSGLNNPHGVAFKNNFLYIAEETRIGRYLWTDNDLIGGVARLEKKLFDLPKGGRHHTRSIAFDEKGSMYVSIGSSCDVCIEKNPFLGSVIISDWQGKKPEIFASGLRNAPFITINPDSQELWGTEMGRDFLGDNLPPDEINIIKKDKNYGWPICYGNKKHDIKFDTNEYTDDPCIQTIPPSYEIAAHSAPLGLSFIKSTQYPDDWQGDLLVAYHGSWNRSAPIGYKVVRLVVEGNNIIKSEDFVYGFLQGTTAVARPVDLEFDKKGNLYISDDKSGYIFILSKII